MTPAALRRVEAFVDASLSIVRAAPTGRIALARVAAAIEPEWIPGRLAEELAGELERASAAACEPLAPKAVQRALAEAWGSASELDALDSEPVAVTPTAQVHRGEHDGEPVAVKIVRPGLARSARQDLTLLDGLLRPLGAAFPRLDGAAIVREVRERLLEELDLEHEAGVQRRFHRALRGHHAFHVPAPVTSLARDGVLVSAWVDGTPMREAPDRDVAAARLVAFVLGAGRFGIVHADPDPDDVLVLDDGRLAILDYGATRTVGPARMDLVADALDAVAVRDVAALGDTLEGLGWLPAEHAELADDLARHSAGDLLARSRLDSAAVVAARDRALSRPDDLARLLVAGSLPPADLWPARAGAQLFGTIARVGAQGDWLSLARDAARRGWDAAA